MPQQVIRRDLWDNKPVKKTVFGTVQACTWRENIGQEKIIYGFAPHQSLLGDLHNQVRYLPLLLPLVRLLQSLFTGRFPLQGILSSYVLCAAQCSNTIVRSARQWLDHTIIGWHKGIEVVSGHREVGSILKVGGTCIQGILSSRNKHHVRCKGSYSVIQKLLGFFMQERNYLCSYEYWYTSAICSGRRPAKSVLIQRRLNTAPLWIFQLLFCKQESGKCSWNDISMLYWYFFSCLMFWIIKLSHIILLLCFCLAYSDCFFSPEVKREDNVKSTFTQ